MKIGSIIIGGGLPIRIQSMCSTATTDIAATVRQIKRLESHGCEIIRVSVPDRESALALKKIKKSISIPLVADIHFDHRLAIEAVCQGADKIRINPGNIGSEKKVKDIVSACKDYNTAIRIGVNAGSLKFLKNSLKWKVLNSIERAEQMVREALEYVHLFESLGFYEMVISLKAADVETTHTAYRLISKECVYPLHIGITEAGSLIPGIVKSAIGIGQLLREGIGDTIRVSLTEDTIYEVKCAKEILKALGLRKFGPEIISCPTCARCKINISHVVHDLEDSIDKLQSKKIGLKPKKIAVMGCVVNGPGEARDADIGIAGGKGTGLLFKNGKPVKKIPEKAWVEEIIKELTQRHKGTKAQRHKGT